MRGRTVVKVDDYATDGRWPETARRAVDVGVHSSLSLPLLAADDGVGALNLYGASQRVFDGLDDGAATFAASAAITLANALAFHRAAELSEQLSEGLESRDVIGQAKGILMARERIDADAAFDRLREMSQHANRKLRDIAAELVDEANSAARRS
jgi:GAF domain-containing protein